MSGQQTSLDLGSVTFLQASPAGVSPCNSQEFPQKPNSGPEVAPARRLAAPEKRKAALSAARAAYFRILSKPEYSPAVSAGTNGTPTIDTFGRSFIGSSASAVLQSCMASRLADRMGKSGSLEYELVWKSKDMALGPAMCALRASGRRTSGRDCTGWPSPTAFSSDQTNAPGNNRFSAAVEKIAGQMIDWPTPMANKNTPQQRDDFTPTLAAVAEKALSGYPTPRAEDAESSGARKSRGVADTLTAVANLSGWMTPTANEDAVGRPGAKMQVMLATQAKMVSGTTGESSTSLTEKRGALNPELSRWLQGFPETWTFSGRTAMASMSTSRKRSSKPTKKPFDPLKPF